MTVPFRWVKRILPLLIILFVGTMLVAAQEESPRPVTYDDINAVAGRMFCPECENIPLDKCYTSVCLQWKQDIAQQLAAGASADQIIDGFVARFGDQVVGVPQDPFLRNLALITPTIFLILAVVLGGYTIWSRVGRMNGQKRTASVEPDASEGAVGMPESLTTSDEKYLDQLRRDVSRD